jgi:hypothetical protein
MRTSTHQKRRNGRWERRMVRGTTWATVKLCIIARKNDR